jgi:DNA modification methylase
MKGEFIAPPEEFGAAVTPEALPKQEDFWRPPVRFGSIPVEKEPLGWDRRRGFRKLFPAVMLPTQVVERVAFGHPELEPNRLFWGDNLHVMRQLPSQSIDLIYIDPPFFSGRQYNVIFGDQNELRSFSDIWEGGMPGYLIWLDARLYEMKRLLKKTGSIYVHCDWHASHYIKVEMDKIFGHENFRNEIVWFYEGGGGRAKNHFNRKHDVILFYSKGSDYKYNLDKVRVAYKETSMYSFYGTTHHDAGKHYAPDRKKGKNPDDVWVMNILNPTAKERIGYPTQKPLEVVQRIVDVATDEGDVVADFFMGGGTTLAAAIGLRAVIGKPLQPTTYEVTGARRFLGCDQSRIAVAITADRITNIVEERIGRLFPVPDYTIEHWGVYEAGRLSKTPPAQFREFVLRAFGARPDDSQADIYGTKGAVPVWVGEPSQRKGVTARDVEAFANAIRKTVRYQQDNLRDGIMLAWAYRKDAIEAANRLRELQNTDLNFIRLEQVRIDSPHFREQVAALSTEHADYENFLTFVQPPKVEMGWKRIAARTYKFDVSETAILNAGAKIINVQWDFDYGKRFSSTQGFSFVRGKKKEPALQAQYEFPSAGTHRIACKVQDDMGGEAIWTGEIEVK